MPDVGGGVPGATVYIWCETEDVDGDTLSYEWSAGAGEAFGEGPSVVWLVPDELGIHRVTVKVDYGYGGVAERSIPVSVSAAEPPEIRELHIKADHSYFRPYYDSRRILRELSITIEARVDDEDRSCSCRLRACPGLTIRRSGQPCFVESRYVGMDPRQNRPWQLYQLSIQAQQHELRTGA